MNQDGKILQKGKKGGQKVFFGNIVVGKPLYALPAFALPVKAANKIKAAGVCGKPGSFNIEKSTSSFL